MGTGLAAERPPGSGPWESRVRGQTLFPAQGAGFFLETRGEAPAGATLLDVWGNRLSVPTHRLSSRRPRVPPG